MINMVVQKPELDIYQGKFLNSRYLIRELIGKGGMGKVYLAEDTAKGGKSVALKILSLNLINQQMSQRFAKEIFIGAQLGRKSQHIVRVLSYGLTEEKIPFYVMEYLHGKNLKTILKRHNLNILTFLEFAQQICLGLQCAHQGIKNKGEIVPIVHRDIKPENIFITEDPKQGELVKILDFGIAKFLTERSGMTTTESFIGSLPYCSPEHIEGRKILDVRSDIYSLGVLMFEMLTGKHPFQLKSQSFGSWYQAHKFQQPINFDNIRPRVSIPQDVSKLVISCLAKEVNHRPQNITEVLEKLQQIKYNLENNKTSNNVFISNQTQLIPLTSITEKICLEKNWPKNKPIAPIGFPNLLQLPQGSVATFWAMLPKQEILKFINQSSGTEFIAKVDLYPMILWLTVLYDGKSSLTRWLSYFLDLKDDRSQSTIRYLSGNGYYHLLLFALEEPEKCCHVMTFTLTAQQRQQLVDCLENSQKSHEVISPHQSKTLLKAQYEKVKMEILRQVVVNHQLSDDGLKKFLGKLIKKFTRLFQTKLDVNFFLQNNHDA
jgi:eukaryotic-like serine/threonine-protein kinase